MVPQLWPRSSCSTSAVLHHVLLLLCIVLFVCLLLFFFVVVVVLGGRPLSCSRQVSSGLQFLRWNSLTEHMADPSPAFSCDQGAQVILVAVVEEICPCW